MTPKYNTSTGLHERTHYNALFGSERGVERAITIVAFNCNTCREAAVATQAVQAVHAAKAAQAAHAVHKDDNLQFSV